MIKLPPNNQWSQPNDSEKTGSLWSSFNLDLSSNKGFTKVSPSMIITTDDITDLGIAVGFVRFNSTSVGFWTVAGSYVFKTTEIDPSAVFAKDAQSGTPTTCSSDLSDIFFFRAGNKLVVSVPTDIYYNSGAGSWANITGTPLTGSTVHMFAEFGNRLYVTDSHKTVLSTNAAMDPLTTSGANTFSLGTLDSNNVGLIITSILTHSSGIWILTTTSQYGEFGQILDWDGAQENNPTSRYILDCGGAVAGVVKDDTLYIMTVEAELLVNNGGTFSRIPNGKLPVDNNKFLKNSFSTLNNRWIHPNGMIITNEGKINILINNEYEDGTIEENMPSGVWEFDPQNTSLGWYHKMPMVMGNDFGQNRVSRVGGLNYVKTPNKVGTLLLGAQVFTGASATKEVIETNDTADTNTQKYGYLVTPFIYSSEIQDTFKYLIARLKRLVGEGTEIVVKYRTQKTTATEFSITWYNGGSGFKVTNTDNIEDFEVGDEVEITQGLGGGLTAHITAIQQIDSSNDIWEIQTDVIFNANAVNTDTGKARFQKWEKSSTMTVQDADYYKFIIGATATKIQLKICMKFLGDNQVDDFILVNSTHTKAE